MIPHNKPSLGREEIAAVEEVLKSGWLVQGPKTEEFENKFCKFLGLPKGHGVAMCNGTAALYVALKVLGVGKGDEVIIPTYICTSLLNSVYEAQAKPVIVDIGEKDFNISLVKIKEKMSHKTKAIIAPHMFGVPMDIALMRKELGVPIIEDCAQAIGSKVGGKYVGTLSDIAIFSFYTSKMIATGQGGMVVSKNKKYVAKARDYIDFDLGKGKRRGKRAFYPRFNFEITDIQSALGIAQLGKIGMFLRNRKSAAKAYEKICKAKGWDFQKPTKSTFHPNHYRFVLKADRKTIPRLRAHLLKRGISSIIPVENWELLHNFLGLNKKNFSVAEAISKQTLSIPVYPNLVTEGNMEKVLSALKSF